MVAAESETTMPPTETKRETWADWIREIDPDYDEAPEEYITIDELIQDVNGLLEFKHVEIKPSTIRYWQSQGILPYPVKRWHDGAVRALYPSRAAYWAILHLRSLQMNGMSIEEIKPRAKEMLLQRIALSYDPSPYALGPAIQDAIRKRDDLTSDPVTHVDVTFFSEKGGKQTYTFYPPEDSSELAPDNG